MRPPQPYEEGAGEAHLRIALALIFFCAACVFAAGAQEPVAFKEHGGSRDAVVDDGASRAFVAAYERNQIWTIDLATGAKVGEIAVGRGPVALAREGWALACVNRLDNTVSIIRLPEGTVSNTVNVGAGPVAIVAAGNGKFVVANAFGDSLSVIDAGTGAVQELVEGVPAVLSFSGGCRRAHCHRGQGESFAAHFKN